MNHPESPATPRTLQAAQLLNGWAHAVRHIAPTDSSQKHSEELSGMHTHLTQHHPLQFAQLRSELPVPQLGYFPHSNQTNQHFGYAFNSNPALSNYNLVYKDNLVFLPVSAVNPQFPQWPLRETETSDIITHLKTANKKRLPDPIPFSESAALESSPKKQKTASTVESPLVSKGTKQNVTEATKKKRNKVYKSRYQHKRYIKNKVYKSRYQHKRYIKNKLTAFSEVTGDVGAAIFITKNDHKRKGYDVEFFAPENPSSTEAKILNRILHQFWDEKKAVFEQMVEESTKTMKNSEPSARV